MDNVIFQVGITRDWQNWTGEGFEGILADSLGRLPNLQFEVMPETGGPTPPGILDRYDAVIAFAHRFPKESFAGVNRLLCISRWGVGYDYVDIDACSEAGVLVALTPEAVRRPMAEGILAMIFSLGKNLHQLDQRVRGRRWREGLTQPGVCVQGKALGSVGVGNIAIELFRMARGLGFGRLLGFDPFVKPDQISGREIELVDLDTLLRESDFVTINVPLNSHTKGLIGARELALMKPTAYVINTARGSIVDEKALLEALREGRIAGAGLDVFEQEPPPADHPLLDLDNTVFAPHSVGWTHELIRDLNSQSCHHVEMVYRGEVPPWLANPQVVEHATLQAKLAARKKP